MTRWLIVIDMQTVFADPRSPWYTDQFVHIEDSVAQLIEFFADTAVFTRFVAPITPTGAWTDYYEEWPFALQPPDSPLYQVVPRFTRHARHTVDASTFGKWTRGLAARIDRDDEIYVCGVSTDCCVLSTVLAAADTGVKVHVIDDACAGSNMRAHRGAIDLMALYAPLVSIVSVADVIN